jgi:hypothetical protein
MPYEIKAPLTGEAIACQHPRIHLAAPCYWSTRLAALNGGRGKLSAEELAFVGAGSGAPPRSGGWHQIGDLPALASADSDSAQGSETDAAMLKAMQALGLGRERLRFLGG